MEVTVGGLNHDPSLDYGNGNILPCFTPARLLVGLPTALSVHLVLFS